MQTAKSAPTAQQQPVWRDMMHWPGRFLNWVGELSELLPIEESIDHGVFVLRAEIPGIVVERDLDVKLEDGVLTIQAQRLPPPGAPAHSEMRYGAFHRIVHLPEGAWSTRPRTAYNDGILEIRVSPSRHDRKVHPA